jgi:hypothetical protein
MKERRAPEMESARLGGERRVCMVILHGQTVQMGQRVTYISWSGHVRVSKRGLNLYGFPGAALSVHYPLSKSELRADYLLLLMM